MIFKKGDWVLAPTGHYGRIAAVKYVGSVRMCQVQFGAGGPFTWYRNSKLEDLSEEEKQTYKLYTGSLVYVQDIQGQKVICNRVGDVDRKTISLGRFAAMCVSEEPNQ